MKIKPVGTSLVIEMIERATRKSGLVIKQADQTVFTAEVLALSQHLSANTELTVGDSIIFVGHSVETPVENQFIIDAEQIIGVLQFDEEGN